MLTLTLDGNPVDLPADAEIALSYRSSDLRRLDTREAAFSETFALPVTHQNARVLGHPHALTSQTSSPYRRVPAVLTANGVPVLRGVALLDGSADGYEITLLDDTADLFGRVGDAKLRDLNLTALDHPRTFVAIQAASTDDPTRGYIYALADTARLGTAGGNDRVTAYEVPASVYEIFLLRAIVARAIVARALPGFALTGTLLADPLFARAVLPGVYSLPRLRETYLAPRRVQASTSADLLYEVLAAGQSQIQALDLLFPVLALGNAAYFAGGASYSPPTHFAEVTVSGRLLVKSDGFPKFLTLHGASQALPNAYIWRQAIAGRIPAQRSVPYLITFSVTVPAITLANVGALSLRVSDADNGSAVPSTDPYIRLTVLAGSAVTFAVSAPALAGAPVHLETSLPDISQADYLKSLANRFNSTFAVDTTARTVRFDLFNELERRRGEALDWTNKVDYAARPRIDYRLPGFAQRNLFRYADAPAAYAPAFGVLTPLQAAAQVGTGALTVPDTTLPLTADTYTAPLILPTQRPVCGGTATVAFLPSAILPDPVAPRGAVAWTYGGSYLKGDRVTFAGRTWTCQTTPYGIKSQPGDVLYVFDWAADAVPDTAVPAVAVLVALSPAAPLLSDEQVSATTPASFQPAWGLGTDGLSFAALLLTYQAGTAALLARVQLLAVPMRLTPADIAGLDFSRPVRLDVRFLPGYGEVQGLFYLNLIDQYRPGIPGLCRVELLRLGDPIPALAPAALPLATAPNHALYAETGQQLAQQPDLATNGPLLEQRQ